MRLLLAQNGLYFPAHGGGDKSNRLLMEGMASRGHQVRVVARTGAYSAPEYRTELTQRGVSFTEDAGVIRFSRADVEVVVATGAGVRAFFAAQIEEFQPNFIVASTDDPAQLFLEPALESGVRIVYLVRATIAVPFGPDCAFPSEARTARIRQCDLIIGVSEYVAGYVRKWAKTDAIHVPISLMEPVEAKALGQRTNEFVTLVNPCAVKGLSIFLGLADAMPQVKFAAVPTWGTDAADLVELQKRANVTLLEPVDRIDDLLGRTNVLLIPSLWAEARSRMVMEGMLRGIPVLASDTGGLSEAKLGVPYVLPVRPIVKYKATVDDRMVPVAEVPEQDIGPWRKALERLLGDEAHYQEIGDWSRRAALEYAEKLTAAPFEGALAGVSVRRKEPTARPPALQEKSALSEEKRQLLAIRLRQKAPAAAWFPGADAVKGERRFWFPHAGAIRGNAEAPWIGVVLPGRGARLAEAPFTKMEALIEALAGAIDGYLDTPFVFLGHSMGAVVAFELARALRRRGKPLPRVLIASAARAPQFRSASIYAPLPEPTDEELLRQADLPDDAGVRRAFLPALRADTSLYRKYVYEDGEKFDFPIRAYGGEQDANVSRAHLEAWGEQTRGDFRVRSFAGGHFYLRDLPPDFRAALEEDLA